MNSVVRCPSCGQTHGVLNADEALASVEAFNRASERGGWGQVASYERYLRCSRCATDSALMLPTVQSQWEAGLTIQCVVVKR